VRKCCDVLAQRAPLAEPRKASVRREVAGRSRGELGVAALGAHLEAAGLQAGR
jgi:hypothetical protein